MKRYIKSSGFITSLDREPQFDSSWSEDDITTWKSIDWDSVKFGKDYRADDTFQGNITIYGLPSAQRRPVTFVKCFRRNPLYPPYYAPIIPEDLKQFLRENHCVGPMFDGNTHNGYDIHDRYETQTLYNQLST